MTELQEKKKKLSVFDVCIFLSGSIALVFLLYIIKSMFFISDPALSLQGVFLGLICFGINAVIVAIQVYLRDENESWEKRIK